MAVTDARFRAMGSDCQILVVAETPVLAAGLADSAHALVDELERRWTRFRDDSELSLLNAHRSLVVSAPTFDVIEHAVEGWHATDGRFDPTVSVRDLGYAGPWPNTEEGPLPPGAGTPGCGGIELDATRSSVRLPDGVALDLGGIGKGRAADLLCAALRRLGADGALVNLGGDLRVWGTPPSGGAWQIGVEHAFATEDDLGQFELSDGGVATSSTVHRSWSRNGVTVHHLIDPATGLPTDGAVVSATVVAGEAWWAEVLAKAAMVAGLAAAPALLHANDAEGILVGADRRVVVTAGLAGICAGAEVAA